MTEDRTLTWLEAFAKAEVIVTSFESTPGGFLRSVTWRDAAIVREPRPVRDRVRRWFLVRMFTWDVRKGLRKPEGADEDHTGAYRQAIECERIAVHVVLPGLTPARGDHWTRYIGDGVNIETADALGDNGERWHALCVNGVASVIHVPPLTWDRDTQLDADPRRAPPNARELTDAQAIERVVRVYAACARSFAANPLSPRLRKHDVNAAAIPPRVLEACTSWLLIRSGLDMDSNQE